MTEELKRCPFCGGDAEWQQGEHGDKTPWHYIACSECEAMGSCRSCQREGLIYDWNQRLNTDIVIGDYIISEHTVSSHDNIFIRHSSGEGGEFKKSALHDMIEKFYKDNF